MVGAPMAGKKAKHKLPGEMFQIRNEGGRRASLEEQEFAAQFA